MPREFLAAIDAGTTGCRTIIFSIDGGLVSQAYEEHPSAYPSPSWVEQNARDWWRAVCSTSKVAMKKAKIKPDEIRGISVTNQRETIVPVNALGEPLRTAIVWQDRRTVDECSQITAKIGAEKIYSATGLTVDPYFSAPKILWIKRNQSELFSKTYKFLLVHDYITMKLSDQFVTEHSNASRTMLFDIRKMDWSDTICGELEIQKEKMPTLYPPGKRIGEVTKRASGETGFAAHTPVITGAGDQQAAALGVGVTETGRVKATTGTGTFILAFLNEPKYDSKRRVLCSCHAVPGKWVNEASIFTTGAVYRWFRDQFAQAEKIEAERSGKDPYDLLNDQAARVPAGSRGVMLIPHCMGSGAPHWNPYDRGVMFGFTIGHEKGCIVRAIMEGTAFEIRENISVMKEIGTDIREIRVTGGATRSSIWNQIQSDVTNLPVLKGPLEEATAVGAAILAGVGVGIYKGVVEAADLMVRITERYTPDKENSTLYSKLFDIYERTYQALSKEKIFPELSALQP
ncbi:MAG: xylulokinase [Promethearchaeati archaeon SRVP18_Atabeyarchaeia-1]